MTGELGMIKYNPQQHAEIDAAMKMHIETLHDASMDAFVALLTILIGVTSFMHALVRVVYACIGLATWTLGVWIVALQAVRAECIKRSSTSPFRREVQDE
jgi:hypothetical protein